MKRIYLLLTFFLLAGHLVQAQRARNAAEASQNQKAIATNEAQLERDIEELTLFKAKLTEFEKAFAQKNVAKTAVLKKDLIASMQREIEQSERKIAQDKQELSQSKAEAAGSSREVKRSRRDVRTPDNDRGDRRDLRDDRRDKKDDQRDAMDDKADLEQQIARTDRQKQILSTLHAVTFSFEPSSYQKAIAHKELLQEFAITMEQDVAATKAEMVEDKREAAEDRRERREDKRERTEKRTNRRRN